MKVKLIKNVTLPDFSFTDTPPKVSKTDYENRIEKLCSLNAAQRYTHIIVYGDREHFSNIHYLTGYDPRFEEALLIISKGKDPIMVVGCEGISYLKISPVNLQGVLFHSFSLMGMPRQNATQLKDIFQDAGIRTGCRIGLIGWKYFTELEVGDPQKQIDLPHYIVKVLVDLVGVDNIQNVTNLMVHPEYGLRIRLDWQDLVFHEIAGTKSSERVKNVIWNLKPGISEIEASQYLTIDGDPLSAHVNVNFGAERVLMGLASPGYERKLQIGDVINIALGYRHSMVARTGLYTRDEKEVPNSMRDIVQNFYIPYFTALANWYESLKIGVTGGEVYNQVKETLGDLGKYGIELNPGHLIHSDEWTNTVFYPDSRIPISSGMAIQCDIIAFPGAPYVGVHVEDGVVVADETMRSRFRNDAPNSWNRINTRKTFMKETLGINLAEEILPVSNIQGILFPYLGDPSSILARS